MAAYARRMLSLVLIFTIAVCVAMRPPNVQAQPPGPASPGQDCGPVDRGMLAPGQTVTGRIDACHQEEDWEFDGLRGQAVIITMDRPDPPTFGGLEMDPFLRLLRPAEDGDRMVESENDDGGIGVNLFLFPTQYIDVATLGERADVARGSSTRSGN